MEDSCIEDDYINHIDLLEPIRLGFADIIYKDDKQLVFIERRSQALMISMTDISKFKEIYEKENLSKYELINVKQKEIVNILVNDYQKKYQFSCFQEVYMKKEKIELSKEHHIDLLQLSDVEFIAQNYKEVDDIEYIKEIITQRHMWGIFEDNKLAGFIGIHLEGSMGILEILPQYRRKGYGEILEAFLINWYIEHDLVPYCQVIVGNVASLRLQEKLGLQKSQMLSYWLF